MHNQPKFLEIQSIKTSNRLKSKFIKNDKLKTSNDLFIKNDKLKTSNDLLYNK